MTLMARFSGTCPECGGRWQAGDFIRSTTDWDGSGAWVHVVCPDTPSDFEHHQPVCERCWLPHAGTCDR